MKKAQIKMGETLAVLIIFFFLIMLGFSFYTNVQLSSLKAEGEKTQEFKSVEAIQKASFLPELQCSFNNILTDNCFDIEKVKSFYLKTEEDPDRVGFYYYDIFGFSNISIRQIYPSGESLQLYSWPLQDYASKKFVQVPISLYDPKQKSYGFGIMEISVYT